MQKLLHQIAEAYDMEIDTMEVMEDHVHRKQRVAARERAWLCKIAHLERLCGRAGASWEAAGVS